MKGIPHYLASIILAKTVAVVEGRVGDDEVNMKIAIENVGVRSLEAKAGGLGSRFLDAWQAMKLESKESKEHL